MKTEQAVLAVHKSFFGRPSETGGPRSKIFQTRFGWRGATRTSAVVSLGPNSRGATVCPLTSFDPIIAKNPLYVDCGDMDILERTGCRTTCRGARRCSS